MAYAKKKNPKYTSWRRPKLRTHETPETEVVAKHTVSTVILISMIVVVLAVFFGFLSSPERITKQNLETIAKDYYENYLYETIVQSNAIGTENEKKSLDEIMEKYVDIGFAKITFRQLLLFDAEKYNNAANQIRTYCDENQSNIRIYPVAPFGKTDYKVEYNYSCTFP